MRTTPHASVEDSNAILTVTLNRPEKLNAISPAITEVLSDAVRALRDRDDLRVLVIQATGTYFTAGYDITEIDETDRSPSEYRNHYLGHHRLYDAMEEVDKPIILAVQGKCLGAGVEMSGSCDFRFASDTATFRLPEINLAVIPGSGGTSRMTRLIGQHWTKWLAMAGQPVDAQRALMIGLVHDVYPLAGFHQRVREFAIGLTKLPREALGLSKIAINMCANTDPATARDVERLANNVLVYGHEYKQRVADFKNSTSTRT
ncbi:enoyl-CoA hydratase/isomerase family protein [Rhodococcus sp. IEGM 1366]|uniref:enoyl-CoA hydratase/isomerase family protein n=1 Tax=Rhodococcus sp. IEGM 1366 TaxID=3082223 RepID=UPI002954D6C9|nr:enoyl-CoA hydratase/isomerase family protein [Rhodococcus sp. IEGM 1366]MDV8071014.1 enoyl-CoA hydratase/isomerase family protein [Rhodococcus sp. IEGM 1366]